MTTQKVITKDSKGDVKATNEVPSEVVAEVRKVQSIVVKVDKAQLDLCLGHYSDRFDNRVSDLNKLFDFGMLFQSAKKSVNNNNKVFGKWRELNFPGLTSPFVSYSINLIVHKSDVLDWINLTDVECSNREYTNPHTVYTAFNRYKKALADKAMKELAKENEIEGANDTPPTDTPPTDTPPTDTPPTDTPPTDTPPTDTPPAEEVKSGHKVVNHPVTVEEQINHYHLIVNAIIPLLNSEKLNDLEIESIRTAHNSLTVKLKELNII